MIVLPLIITILITMLCNIVFNIRSEWIKLRALGGDIVIPHAKEPAPAIKESESSDVGINVAVPQTVEPSNAMGISMSEDEYLDLLHSFNHELITKKAFLNENINLYKLVDVLGYNRSYLSYLVNKEFGMPFRDVVGQLRINYAMQYMKEHPNSLQETVALECGFTGAPAFNRKFTQIVGMTPRLWYQRNIRGDFYAGDTTS